MPTFIETKFFSADWDRFGLKDDDLRAIQQAIGDDHTTGDVVRGTNGVRKFRMARRGAGKSGGFRVFYAAFPSYETVILVGLLSKNEEANISPADRNIMADAVVRYERALKRQREERS
jgi:hypothetical protein